MVPGELARAPQAEGTKDYLWWTLCGQPLTKDAAQVAIKRHLTRAGLWRASAHKLRHTFGMRLAEAGVDLLVIKDQLDHATVVSTQLCTYVAQWRLREATTRLSYPNSKGRSPSLMHVPMA